MAETGGAPAIYIGFLKIQKNYEGKNKMKNLKVRYLIIFIVAIILIDQLTKFLMFGKQETINIIGDFLQLNYVENTGGAFGIANDSTFKFIIINLVVLGLIIKFIVSQKDRIDKKTAFALSLILAGGFSNLIDRIFRGFVIDFIDVNFLNFPVFNIADICIVVGWILMVVFIIMYSTKTTKIKEVK